jgi:O-antigen biosynthesis protein
VNRFKATVIIPVFNSLWCVEDAVDSVLRARGSVPYRLVLADDGSDERTALFLRSVAAEHAYLDYSGNGLNLGFIKTVNKGLSRCRTQYAVILNSDVVVTDGWLDQLCRVADEDERIGSVNPLTNRASQIEVPLPPGVNFIEANEYLSKRHSSPVDVVTGVGFCMLLRMAALEEVGFFDEVFGAGYCEESDLCMRLTTRGWRTVVATGSYVYHKGAGSFTEKRERYLHNRKIFDERWEGEYQRQYAVFRAADPLRFVRRELASPTRWAPLEHARQVYRVSRGALREGRPVRCIKELVKGAVDLAGASRPVVSEGHIRRFKHPDRLSVTYILPYVTMAGGVISVLQLVNELTLLGIDARIATLRAYPEMNEWPRYVGLMVFRNYDEMLKRLPETDIVVATHWSTAEAALALHAGGRAGRAAYFVQDYEPWFFSEDQPGERRRVEETYRLLPNQIVKSDWLKDMLTPFGGKVTKIRLGMDLRIFYHRESSPKGWQGQAKTLLAMARPKTPRRGFTTLVDTLQMVKSRFPGLRVRLFGSDLAPDGIPFAFENLGILVDRNRLAATYSQSDLFIDSSDFQGFGRTALEAMACGCACVLTGVGGVAEYAKDEVNSLVVPPKDARALADAVCRLIEDEAMSKGLIWQGLETVKDYCHKREARETADFFMGFADKHSGISGMPHNGRGPEAGDNLRHQGMNS